MIDCKIQEHEVDAALRDKLFQHMLILNLASYWSPKGVITSAPGIRDALPERTDQGLRERKLTRMAKEYRLAASDKPTKRTMARLKLHGRIEGNSIIQAVRDTHAILMGEK